MKRLSLVGGIVLVIFFIALALFMKVKSITCRTSDQADCPAESLDAIREIEGKRLITANREMTKMLLNRSEIEKFTVSSSPLGSVSVLLTMRHPDIALKPINDSSYTLYTKNGIVVGKAGQVTVPFVELKEQLPSENISFLASLSYQLTTVLPVSKMSVEGSKLIVELRDSRLVYYPLEGDIDVLLGSTLATFSQLNLSDGKLIIDRQAVTIREIDFRFKNPVLR